MILFAICAPLFSLRGRRLAAFGGGIIAEAFSFIPFGATLGLFLLVAFFVESLEQYLAIKETAGWAVAAFSALGIVTLGEILLAIAFNHITPQHAVALLISEFFIGIIIIGFLWAPIKLSITSSYSKRNGILK